jgi:hypothetical protein
MKLASNLFLELMAVAAVQNRVRRKKLRRFYMTVKRVWHGWATLEDADKYQNLFHNEIFPGIEAKKIPGYQSIDLFRREIGDEVEFVTTIVNLGTPYLFI